MSTTISSSSPLIGVLALQGAVSEHIQIIEALNCRTVPIRTATPDTLATLDGIILPGGESTAMGLIASPTLWPALQSFLKSGKPTWGTCAGMILLADRCIGTSAVITNGQSLIGGVDVLVCRNYFGSQVSSFEMPIPGPPGSGEDYPGVFIRAPAILAAGRGVEVLGRVVARPCRQAAAVLEELDRKIARGENVVNMGVVDAIDRSKGEGVCFKSDFGGGDKEESDMGEEKKDVAVDENKIVLPGAAEGCGAREVICAARIGNVLCTAFHPELTGDNRWHKYFLSMVEENRSKRS